MKIRPVLLASLLLALAACTPGTQGPTHVDIDGAKALYVEQGGPSPSIEGLFYSGASSGSGELHALLPDNSTTAATFTDAKGEAVDVTITRALQLDAERLLIEYTYTEGDGLAVVMLSTGTMAAIEPAPDNWGRIRVRDGVAFYVAGGHLQRVPLDTLAAEDISQGDTISPASLLFLDASGNVHSFYLTNGSIDPANQIRIYYADGSPVDTLGWGSPDAYLLCENYGATSGSVAYEDDATGEVWMLAGSPLMATHVTFDADGVYLDAPLQLAASFAAYEVLTPPTGRAYLGGLALAASNGVNLVPTISGGLITGATTRSLWTYGQPTEYVEGVIYTADAAGVNTVDMATGAGGQLLADTGITDIEVVADQVFYAKAGEIYQYDTLSEVTVPYEGAPPEVIAE